MLRTCIWYAMGWSLLVITYPLVWRARYYGFLDQQVKRDLLANKTTEWICRRLFYMTGSKVQITGLDNVPKQGAVLFVSNHQGHMDSLIIHGFIHKPKAFISIIEVLKIPIIRTWMKLINCEFIDRKNARQSLTCMNQAIHNLEKGRSMVVFPEGKLNDGGTTYDFQRGWLRMAIRSGVPIIPVSISGSYKILAKNGSWVQAASVQCVISKPILSSNLKKVDEAEFIRELRSIIIQEVNTQTDHAIMARRSLKRVRQTNDEQYYG